MKKRGSLFKYLLTFLFFVGITFLLDISKVYAGTAHDLSFKIYNCYSLDEDALQDVVNPDTNRVTTPAHYECLGPNGDGNTPLMSTTNVPGVGNVIKLEPGQVIKVGFHYIPGSVPTIGVGMKYLYEGTSLDIVKLSKYNRSARTYSDAFGYDLGEDFDDYYGDDYSTTTGLSTLTDYKVTYSTYNTKGSAGDPVEDELDMIYYYFRVKDDATTNTKLDFTWDTAPSGISIGNGEPYNATNISVYVEVPLSDDNTLGALSVKNGSTTYPLTPTFTPGSTTVDSYTAYIPKNITSVDIEAEPNDTKATLTGDGTVSDLSVGNNSNTITVLSESGDPKDYTVNVYRLSDDADLSALTLSGIDFGTFSPSTTSYSKTVPYTTSSTTVGATVHDTGKATASGTGNKNLQVGENTISVEVTPENCKSDYSSVPGNTCTKKTYTVTVTREAASEDATLSDLKVDGTSVPGFDPDTYEYNLPAVANDKASVNITYDTTDNDATVTGNGTRDLSVGDNALEVVVTAQDGTTKKTYTINIKRKSNDNTLSSLTVTSDPQGTLSPAFDPSKTSYTFSVDADENEVTIDAVANNEGATVTGTGTYNPRTTNSVTVKVTPEDGEAKEYVITFDVAKSANADLASLGVTGYTISPSFDKDTITYNVTVPSDIDKATITAELADDRGSLTGDGEQDLDYGENSFPVIVTAEDGTTTKTYTVNITREKKTIATLSDLKVDGTSVPGFDPDTYEYNLPAVANDKASVNITYDTTDNDATVTGNGTRDLSVGDNALEVVVTAQDGTTKKTYTINIRRKNDDKSLSSLTVTSDPQGTLSPAFDPETTTYTFSVDADEDSVVVSAEAADTNATVTGTGTYNPRTDGPVEVIVTSENGNTKVYTIEFDVAKSTNADLDSLGVTGYTISPSFDKDTLTYNVTVPSDIDKATITAELADDRATLTGTGEKDLDYGENSFDVVVTAEDGTTKKTYTVNITREKKTDADLIALYTDQVLVPGFDKDTLTYDLGEVSSDKLTIRISATLSDEDASLEGTGTKDLVIGDNSFDVVVTAQDGTTKKTYTIKVKRLNSEKNLATLTVTGDKPGSIDPTFDPEVTEYTYTSDPDTTTITVSATVPTGSNATIEGEGEYDPRTTDKVEIVVKAEDGTEKTYTINLELAKSTNADLDSLGVTGYTISPSFDKDTLTYNVTVPSDIDKATITAELADDRATLTGTGEKDINYGENSFDVVVTAEDGTTTKTYKVNITREKKTDANLTGIKVDGVAITGFDPDVTEYTIDDVNSDVDSINIEATLSDDDATLTGTGTKTVQTGANSFDIVVTAQDGETTKTYTVNVKKKSSDSSLSGITITSDPAGTFEPAFDPSVTEYTYIADPDEDEVIISATPTQDGADVIGEGTYNPQDTDTVELIVTAEDGTTTTYVIHLENAESTNANLSSLGVTGETISPSFDKDTLSYTVTVDSDTDKATITATAEDDRSTLTGTGEKDLTYGSNQFEVKVTAEDGTEKVYTVTIERELSSDVKLSDLKVDGDTIDGFDPDVPTYTLPDVGNDVDSIKIEATPENDEATVEVVGADSNGNVPLEVGENNITVKVTAQDGSVGTYTITVNREADSNNDLKSLDVEGYEITPTFDPDTTEYTLTVPEDVDSIKVTGEPDSDKATVEGLGDHDLQPGENTITVKVTAEDGTEKTYTINVTKEVSDEKITSVTYGHEIDDTYILTGNLNAKGINMKDELDNDNEKLTITLPATRDDDGNIIEEGEAISDNDYIATGYEVVLKVNGVEKDRKIIVIKGDVDGNGEITLLDGVSTCYHYLGVSKDDNTKPKLSGAYLLAANIDDNPEITLLDAVSIVYHYVGNVPIQYKTNYTREGE